MKNFFLLIVLLIALSCEVAAVPEPEPDLPPMSLKEMAELISSLPLTTEHLEEVEDAVTESLTNGYDEEYMMADLICSPGSGVGSNRLGTKAASYANPLRNLIKDYLAGKGGTKAGGIGEGMSLDECLHRISVSDMQIYWPFHELWDGRTLPVITFDPGNDAISNIGYEIVTGDDGSREVHEMIVTESIARERPVWVINSNDDSAYTTFEMMELLNPVTKSAGTKAEGDIRSLLLKEFKMKRHYDSWFRGASEFFVKCGAVSGFTASTEAEIRLYQPTVTDFMIVVRRSELLVSKTYNCLLISDWTDQLEDFAFMVVEDDGGTRTSWKTEANVKVQSKSYGISLELPYNERDDIVWRGSLSSRYFESYKGETGHFGDVDIIFDLR